ncbi:MAG: alkyl sulfatase C-terminal domain-containing protein, partial [Solirubrobacterales bacterium]
DSSTGNIIPGGGTNPVKALQMALQTKPQLLFILSDNITGAGRFEVDRGQVDRPDATITTDPTTLIDVLHGRRELADATAAGELEIEGDEAVAARFLQLCPLPSVPA